MKKEDYNILLNYAKKRIRTVGISTSLIQAEDIVSDAFIKVGAGKSIREYEIEISNKVFEQLKTPKSIYRVEGLLKQKAFIESEEFRMCLHCKELKPINEFWRCMRYSTGLIYRLKRCKKCAAENQREYYERTKERRRSYANIRLKKAKQSCSLYYIKKLLTSKGLKAKDITKEMLQKKYNQLRTVGVNDKRGEKNFQAKLTNENVIEVKKLLLKGVADDEIGNMFNVGRSTIRDIRLNVSWKWLTVEKEKEKILA